MESALDVETGDLAFGLDSAALHQCALGRDSSNLSYFTCENGDNILVPLPQLLP